MRREFTTEDDNHLIAYIAVENPEQKNRTGKKLYRQLVENADGKWDWANRHPSSAWLEHYKKNQDSFNHRIQRYQEKHTISRAPSPLSSSPSSPTKRVRNEFTRDEDMALMRFLAKMAPLKQRDRARAKLGRKGHYIYEEILCRHPGTYPWASTHPWRSWRERYVKRQEEFDMHIDRWQKKRGIDAHAQAKEIGERYAKIKRSKPKVGEHEEEVPDKTGSLSKELAGKRCRSTGSGEDTGEDDSARPRKRQKRRDIGHSGHAKSESESSSEELVESKPRSRPRPQSLEEVREEEEEQVDKPVEEVEEVERIIQGSDEFRRDSLDNLKQDGDLSIPPDKASKHMTSPFVASNIAWPPFKDYTTSTADVGSVYPALPLAPPPPLQPPDRIPGGYPASPKTRQMAPHTLPEPSSVARSHPPTPPPTNIQSDASIQSLGLGSNTPRPSARARGKERALPPISSDGASSLREGRPSPGTGAESSLSAIPGNSQRQVIRKQRTDVDHDPHRQTFLPSSPSSLSDGPFATSPPSPRQTEVIRGMPKPRSGRSFRDYDRVRTRNIVLGDRVGLHIERQESGDVDEAAKRSWLPVRGECRANASRTALSLQPEKTTSTSGAPDAQWTTMPTTRPSHKQVQPRVQEFPAPSVHLGPKAPNNTPLPTVPSTARSVVHASHATESPAGAAVDVFASQKPIASSSKHNPYILRAPHLPEPSTGSTFSRVRSPSPVPRRHDRRRTFGGYSLRPTLPDINLLKQLNGKLSMSRSPASTWTRGSPDIQILPSDASRPSSSRALGASDRIAAHNVPRRKSEIPLVAESVGDSSVPSLDQLSPSTTGLIVQVGLATIFKRMEENHGFSADVVRRTWVQQNMDLNATDKKLLRMRIAAENASLSDGDGAHVSRMDAEQTRILTESTPTIRPSPTSNPHHSPIVYTPPPRSRAAHYRRLSEQGHIWEARQREIELASRASESTNDSTPKADPPKPSQAPVWNDGDDEALRTADEGILTTLSKKFGEEFVRRRFLILME